MSRKITVREALNEALSEEMTLNKDVILLGEEVANYQGAYKISQSLLEKFSEKQVIDTPISEHGFTGIAIGAAFRGLRPIVEFMTFNFSMQAIDQIVNSAAKTFYMSGGKLKCPIVFRGPNGAAAGVAGQHSQNFAAWYSHIPGLEVIAPYSAEDSKGLLKSAIKSDNPTIFLENEILYNHVFEVPDEVTCIPIGKGKILRPGVDLTIVGFSLQMDLILKAAVILEDLGLHAEVIDLRTLKPLDEQIIIESVKKTHRLVVVEEGWFFCGLGATIAAITMKEAFDYLDAPIEIISAKETILPYAQNLEELALPSVKDIINAAKKVCYRED